MKRNDKLATNSMNGKLRILYAVQNVGIDLSQEVGDAVPVKHSLHGLVQEGHEVYYLTLKGRSVVINNIADFGQSQSVPLKVTGKRPFLLLESVVRRIQRELRLPYIAFFDSYRFYEACAAVIKDYDICHEHNGLFSVGTALACRWRATPYVLTMSADPLLERQLLGKPLRGLQQRLAVWAAKFTYKTADKILCVSEPAKKHLINKWQVDSSKISVMPNGVDINIFSLDYDSQTVRVKYGLGDKPVVMFVGGFQLWHGIDILIESFSLVLKKIPDAYLLLVGDGPARPVVERQINELGIANAVHITGIISHQQVPEYLSAADVAAIPYPQLLQELWFSPLKLYEYMAAGKAIVASRAGQIADVIEHGRNGMLVEPGNPVALSETIVTLLTDAAERTRLGQNARQQAVTQHSWEQYIARLESLYRSVL